MIELNARSMRQVGLLSLKKQTVSVYLSKNISIHILLTREYKE